MIYKNELFKKLRAGKRLKGYIKHIRPDNKIDIRLEQAGYAHVEPNAEKILNRIRDSGGFLALSDKSAPEDIKEQLEMSKKTFKKALGALYKQQLIEIKPEGISLVVKE